MRKFFAVLMLLYVAHQPMIYYLVWTFILNKDQDAVSAFTGTGIILGFVLIFLAMELGWKIFSKFEL